MKIWEYNIDPTECQRNAERARRFAEAIRLRGYVLLAGDREALVDALEAMADDVIQMCGEIREFETQQEPFRWTTQ